MRFLNLSVMSIPKFVKMTKNIPFFPILHVFAPLNDVRAYIAWSWKTTLITWIFFYADDIQLQIQVPPLGKGPCQQPLMLSAHAGSILKGVHCPAIISGIFFFTIETKDPTSGIFVYIIQSFGSFFQQGFVMS